MTLTYSYLTKTENTSFYVFTSMQKRKELPWGTSIIFASVRESKHKARERERLSCGSLVLLHIKQSQMNQVHDLNHQTTLYYTQTNTSAKQECSNSLPPKIPREVKRVNALLRSTYPVKWVGFWGSVYVESFTPSQASATIDSAFTLSTPSKQILFVYKITSHPLPQSNTVLLSIAARKNKVELVTQK